MWRKEKTLSEPIQEPIIEDTMVNPDTTGTPKESAYEVQEPTNYKFTVQEFFFKGKKYNSNDLESKHPEILEKLLKTNSFIIKKS